MPIAYCDPADWQRYASLPNRNPLIFNHGMAKPPTVSQDCGNLRFNSSPSAGDKHNSSTNTDIGILAAMLPNPASILAPSAGRYITFSIQLKSLCPFSPFGRWMSLQFLFVIERFSLRHVSRYQIAEITF